MVPKWTRSGPEVEQKWTRSGPEVDRKWTGIGPEMDHKWTRSVPQVDQNARHLQTPMDFFKYHCQSNFRVSATW